MRPRGATDASVVQLAGPAPAGAVASIGSVAVGLDGGTASAAAKAGKQALTVPSLDGLRAFSFLLVFVAHAGLEGIVPGGFGVTVFFFLSGYLITTLMRQEFERYGDVSLKHFYLRRVLRILPPFYLVLIAATAASAGGVIPNPSLDPRAVAAQALHYANYWIVRHDSGGVAPGTGVYWSLAVEEHFYFLFPWLYILLQRLKLSGRGQALVFWAICAAVLAWRCILIYGLHSGQQRTYLATDTRVDNILFGCALAVYSNPMLDETSRSTSRLYRAVLLPLAVGALLVSFGVRDPDFRQSFRYSLQGIALYPIFIVAVRQPDFLPFRVLNLGWVKFLGMLSYSLYLVHQDILYAAVRHLPWLPPVARGVLVLGVSVAISVAIYEVVEKPCARVRKRLSQR